MTSSTETTVEANKALIRDLTERAFNDGDLSTIGDRFAEDYVVHAPGLPPMPPARTRSARPCCSGATPSPTST